MPTAKKHESLCLVSQSNSQIYALLLAIIWSLPTPEKDDWIFSLPNVRLCPQVCVLMLDQWGRVGLSEPYNWKWLLTGIHESGSKEAIQFNKERSIGSA